MKFNKLSPILSFFYSSIRLRISCVKLIHIQLQPRGRRMTWKKSFLCQHSIWRALFQKPSVVNKTKCLENLIWYQNFVHMEDPLVAKTVGFFPPKSKHLEPTASIHSRDLFLISHSLRELSIDGQSVVNQCKNTAILQSTNSHTIRYFCWFSKPFFNQLHSS